jgi:hypothetical protein
MSPLLILSLLLAGTADAQSTHDEWRSLNTGHFRVHYPLEAEPWVLQSASRYESIHAGVVEALGYEPTRVVDVVVMDPYAQANGFAMPLLNAPRMGVFPTAPSAASGLGTFHDWSDDLVTHEDVHLVHMDRPSRNPVGALATRHLLGVGPIALKSPMWAIEGLATMLEGELTGAGRPHGASRAVYLRALALEGKLPSYAELNGTDGWQGRRAPYLVGSAFYEWLVTKQGEQSARDLQARLSARRIRGFDKAFEGVYGAPPSELYARFCAELTQAALDIEDQRPPQQGTLWQEMLRSTGAPAVSPDGSAIAVVQEDETWGYRLVVLSTAENQEAIEAWEEQVNKTLARDPEDVAPLPPDFFAHEQLDSWNKGGRRAVGPRWLPDGESLIFVRWVRQPQGDLLPELFAWDSSRGRTRRITHGAGVRDADPHPSGDWAVAVQSRWGQARLVRVDLSSGALTGVTPRGLDMVLDQPRIDPAGQRIAYLRHQGAWELMLMDIASGTQHPLPLPVGAEPWQLAWDPDGQSLVVSMALEGFVELQRVFPDGRPMERLTQTGTAATAPAPDPSGTGIYYLVPHSDGRDLHFLPADTVTHIDTATEARVPAVPRTPPPITPAPAPTPLAEEPHDYGLGRAEWRPVIGASSWQGGETAELGLRVGDPIGRWELLAQGSVGYGTGPSGGSLAGAWRGLPVEMRAQLFSVVEPEQHRSGGELSAGLLRFGDDRWGRGRAGLWSDLGHGDAAAPYRITGFGHLAGGQRLWLGMAWLSAAAQLDGQHGSTAGAAWDHGTALGELGLGYGPIGMIGGYSRSAISGGGAMEQLRVGGMHLSTMPAAWQATRLPLPALEAGTLTGRQHEAWRAALDVERSLQLYLERHRAGDTAAGLDQQTASVLGLELRSGSEENPLAKIPKLDLMMGIGVVLEDPSVGWKDRPFRDKENYAGWVGLQWGI